MKSNEDYPIVQHQNYTKKFGLMLVVQLLTMVGFNLAIDPYEVFRTPQFDGINSQKIKKKNDERFYKAIDIIHEQPKIIFLGSSRTHLGLNPLNVYDEDGEPAYNLGLPGCRVYELRRYLEHAIVNQPELDQLILGLDFFMFTEADQSRETYREERIGKRYMSASDIQERLLSTQAVSDSFETLRQNQEDKDQPHIGYIRGFKPLVEPEPFSEKDFMEWAHDSIKSGPKKIRPEPMAEIKQLLQIAYEHDIDVRVYISPIHAAHLESIHRSGSWDEFERWKRQIVELTPLWDFSGYYTLTTEPIAPGIQNFTDTSHYDPSLGEKVLDRILKDDSSEQVPKDDVFDTFGVWITPENIDEHLKKIRQDRQQWLKNADSDLEKLEPSD